MVQQLLNHINRYALCKTTDKILLAVSGGIDSMVMLHLMTQAGYKVGVAHCNFQLRGEESDGDEELVRAASLSLNVPFHSEKFDTGGHADKEGISIQMAARDLRYRYFEEILKGYGYDLAATAHHFNDVIESVLLNLVRGTGIDGFAGIAPRKQNVIRPLLFADRAKLLAYAKEHAILWREDASNLTDDYQRNFIRHQVTPLLRELNPNFEDTFRDTHERLVGAAQFSTAFVETFASTAREITRDRVTLEIRKFRELESPAVMLWELIKDLGFRFDQCKKALHVLQPGKIFFSATHQLVVDRSQYIIEKKRSTDFVSIAIEEGQPFGGEPPHVLAFREVSRDNFELQNDSTLAQVDADQLRFPLLWRRWQAGDYFVPLGMSQEKKLSDFLIDLKIPFNSKADITVLESAGSIVWVVGLRISERFKVTTDTKRVLVIEQRPADG